MTRAKGNGSMVAGAARSLMALAMGLPLGAIIALALPGHARAAETPDAHTAALEEIVVTGRKRGEEVLQDVPATITAKSEKVYCPTLDWARPMGRKPAIVTIVPVSIGKAVDS